jgi:hypothetical protein
MGSTGVVGVLAGSAESTHPREEEAVAVADRVVHPIDGAARAGEVHLQGALTGTHGYSDGYSWVLSGTLDGSSSKGGGKGPMRGRSCRKYLATKLNLGLQQHIYVITTLSILIYTSLQEQVELGSPAERAGDTRRPPR